MRNFTNKKNDVRIVVSNYFSSNRQTSFILNASGHGGGRGGRGGYYDRGGRGGKYQGGGGRRVSPVQKDGATSNGNQ